MIPDLRLDNIVKDGRCGTEVGLMAGGGSFLADGK